MERDKGFARVVETGFLSSYNKPEYKILVNGVDVGARSDLKESFQVVADQINAAHGKAVSDAVEKALGSVLEIVNKRIAPFFDSESYEAGATLTAESIAKEIRLRVGEERP